VEDINLEEKRPKKPKKNFFDREWYSLKDRNFDFFYPKYCENSSNTFPIPFFQIVGLFAEDCSYNLKDCYINKSRLFIKGYEKESSCELMLRFSSYENRLVVARVEFIHKRQGKMTELYRILKMIQKKYKAGKIVIESVGTEEMEAWCKKKKFAKEHEHSSNYVET
jgi:hypothetical protein